MHPQPPPAARVDRSRKHPLPLSRAILAAVPVCIALLAASADASVDFGIPHVEIGEDDGDLELTFEFLPVIFSGDDDDGFPTATIYTSSFNPLAGEYTTQPLAGPSSGFVNDDAGFRSAQPLPGADIRLTLQSVVPGSAPAFILFGATVFTEASVGASIILGQTFDLHPTYGLISNDPAFTGSATWNFTVDDARGAFDETLSFALTFSADPQDAVTASLIAGDFNGNGQVEQSDLDLVLNNWGLSISGGVPVGWVTDLPQGLIDQAELDRVLQNWGASAAPRFAAAAVPEPGVTLIAGMLGLAVASRRRRRF